MATVLSLQDVLDAFIDYNGPGGAEEYYQVVNGGWKHWFVAVEDSMQVILGDALLIYRCYILHNKSWRSTMLPCLSWLALCASSILSTYREANLSGRQRLNDPSVLPFLTAMLLLTFSTSLVTTFLITRRLWTVASVKAQICDLFPSHFLDKVAMVFFETGMIYSLSIIGSLGVYLSGSNIEYVATLSMIHIIPITCNLLLISVGGIDRTHTSDTQRSAKSLNTVEAKV